MTKFKTRNHWYILKALEKRYRRLLSGYSPFLNTSKLTSKTSKRDFTLTFDVKKRLKEWRIDVFLVFEVNLLELGWEIGYIRLKVLYIVFRELSIDISVVTGFKFCHFSSIFRGSELCLGNGKNDTVTSQGWWKFGTASNFNLCIIEYLPYRRKMSGV